MDGGSRPTKHCRTEFMKHVLPRLDKLPEAAFKSEDQDVRNQTANYAASYPHPTIPGSGAGGVVDTFGVGSRASELEMIKAS